jgi:signal transduction histidine kinase
MVSIHSITFRLTLLYSAYFCLVIIISLGSYYYFYVESPTNALKDQLRQEAAELSAVYERGGVVAATRALDVRRHKEAGRDPFDALINGRGAVVSSNLPSWPARSSQDWLRIEADLHLDGQEEDREALVLDHQLGDGARLLIGRNIEDLDDLEEQVAQAATVFLPIAATLAIVGGALISWSVGRRIEALDSAVRRIMGSTLSDRIPLAGKNDDLDHLAAAVNAMLSRLEVAVDALRRTSDSVAHELRTPLARLQSHLEEMAESESPSPDSIARALSEVERLAIMFDTVLTVTQLESGSGAMTLREVDMSQILTDAADLYAGIAEERDLRFDLRIDAGLHARGSAELLFRSACNLLDNAMKYTPPGGAVALEAHAADRDILILISDTGPGISSELHGLVLQRFYRAPSTAPVPGLGMGLAFVAAVNRIHGASLTFTSGKGLRVEWRIPSFEPGSG